MRIRKMLFAAAVALMAGVGFQLFAPLDGSAQSLQCGQLCNLTYCEYTPNFDIACEDIVQGTCDTYSCPI